MASVCYVRHRVHATDLESKRWEAIKSYRGGLYCNYISTRPVTRNGRGVEFVSGSEVCLRCEHDRDIKRTVVVASCSHHVICLDDMVAVLVEFGSKNISDVFWAMAWTLRGEALCDHVIWGTNVW